MSPMRAVILLLILLWPALDAQAQIQVMGATTAVGTNGSPRTITIPVPSGTTSGDLLVAAISVRWYQATVTPPSGWSAASQKIEDTPQSNGAGSCYSGSTAGIRTLSFYKVAGASESAPVFTYASNCNDDGFAAAGMLRLSGVDTSNPIVASAEDTTGNSTSHRAPSVDSGSETDTLLVTIHSYGSSRSWSAPDGMTERVDQRSYNYNNSLGTTLGVFTQSISAAGATGTRTATGDGDADYGATQSILLRPTTGTAGELVATYHLDEYTWNGSPGEVTDSSGNDNNGTATGSAQPTSSGKICYGANIPSNNTSSPSDAIDTGIDIDSDVGSRGSITLWYRSNEKWKQGGNRMLLDASMTSSNKYFYLALNNDGKLTFALEDSNDEDIRFETSSKNYPANEWVHIAITWDLPGRRYEIYINGSLAKSNTTNSNGTLGDLDTLYLGDNRSSYHPDGTDNSANGILDEVRIYRKVINATQITADMNATHDCPVGAVSEWRMDEPAWNGTGNEVVDDSGNGYHGTSVNGATTTTSGKVCRAGTFDGTDDYVTVSGLSSILKGTASLAFWIKTTQTGDNTAWKAPGVTGVEQSGGADDIFWGWLDASGHIGIAVGDNNDTKSTIAVNNGAWHHVVLSRDATSGAYKIYIDGVLNKSGSTPTGLIGTTFSSIGRIEDTGGSPEYFQGDLDEVLVFDRALSDASVQTGYTNQLAGKNWDGTARECQATSTLHHIRLLHDGEGLTCMGETITVKACADEACDTTYTDDVTVDLTSPTSGWSSDPITVSGGSTTVNLSHTTAGTIALGASATSPTANNATTCHVGTTATCAMTFADAGFIISTDADGAGVTVPAQVAGTASGTFYLRAVKTNSTTKACEAALTGATAIDFAYECNNPTTCYGSNLMSVNGGSATTIARNNSGSVSNYTGVNLTFDANGNAPFTFTYNDVGQVTLHARKTVNSATLSGSSNPFVVKPAKFSISVTGNPAAADANGTKFKKAGESFSATVTAQTSDGATTPSYGGETVPEGILLTHTLVAPLSGATGTLGGGGGSFTNGVATATNLTWDEVGIITLTAAVKDGNYLGAGNVTSTSGNVGRFYPDHFAVTTGAITEGCDSGNFTYLAQDGFTTAFTLTAENVGNATTSNYTGAFAKLDLTTWNDASATSGYRFGATGLPAGSTLASGATTPTGSWSNGVATVSATHQVSRPAAPVAPADVTVTTLAKDSDDVTLAAATAVQSAATPLRYGRLKLANAHGSELQQLFMSLGTEYYSGNGWLSNTDDSCTPYDSATDAALSDWTGNLGSTDTTLSGAGPVAGGVGSLIFSAPGTGNDGSVQLTLTVPAHLRFDWNGDGSYTDNPAARATFGVYRGSDEIIYLREVY